MEEIWRGVRGFEGLYEVSSLGRIRSVARILVTCNGVHRKLPSRIIKLHKKWGYYFINLNHNYETESRYVHRVVAEAFYGPPNGDLDQTQVNHINGVKTDNRVENLEWCTRSENALHSSRVLLNSQKLPRGVQHRDCRFSEDDVQYIRTHYVPRHPEFGARALARAYGVSHSSIRKIIKRKSWEHIK